MEVSQDGDIAKGKVDDTLSTEATNNEGQSEEVNSGDADVHGTNSEVTTELKDGASEEDPAYMYIQRTPFTSEIYKIEIGNLPHVGFTQIKKLLSKKLKLHPHKVKLVGNHPQFVFVTFKSESDREEALKAVNGHVYKGKTLWAKKANPIADPLIKKRKLDASGCGDTDPSESAKKKTKPEEEDGTASEPVLKSVKDAVIPLWNMPYEEQLKQKENFMKEFLVTLGRRIVKVNPDLHQWLQNQRKEHLDQCCPLLPIKPSPVTSFYRNKNEFTISKDREGNKTVGFRLSCYKNGSVCVAEPDECINIPEAALKAAKSFQEYVRRSSKDAFNPENYQGYWRQLTVRTSKNGDLLLIIVMHPQQLTKEEIEIEEKSLTEYFNDGDGASCGVTSLFLQLFAKKEANMDSSPNKKLFGKDYVEETVLDMTFHIGPKAFFQINTDATEVLYKTLHELANVDQNTTVVDICCGTGTIGLTFAKKAAKIIGIECCAEAICNANQNASINGITNAEFVCGKAEDVIRETIAMVPTEELIAIVDPPRAGLHPKVIKSIRSSENLKKLLYVSCNANAALTNFVDLCRAPSNNYKGDPFVPVKAVPVDLFPHTNHCELVILFEKKS